ncbi:MAG: glycosyltransferase family 4 protein [Bacteroidales bacterium]|nr:glycosyltransferase family 4 protein [Bacteroidales bacterium]
MKLQNQNIAHVDRKIVFVNQATGYLTIDIINEFVSLFDKVALIAGSIRIQDIEIDNRVGISKIIRYNRGGMIKKAYSWFIGTIQIFCLLVTRYRKYEVFFTTLPPTAYLMGYLLKRRKFSVLFYDIYPEALKILNIKEGNIIYRIWSSVNIKILKNAYRIYTLSDGMKMQLKKYTGENDIAVIPNWSGLTFDNLPSKDNNPFLLENKLNSYFLVEYSGNIGFSHRVEIVVELARILAFEKDIVFLIIGRGERLEYIKSLIKTYGLSNCITMPFQSDDKIIYSLSAADLSVVTLDDRAPAMSVPSKVYNLLKVGSPIMGIGASDSELARLLDVHQNGRNFPANELHKMAEFIRQLKNSPEIDSEMRKGSILASKKYTSENARKYLELYLQLN